MTTYVSQGSAATDLRGGGSFNSTFLCRYFLNVTVKKNYGNWSTSNKVLPFGARGSGNYDSVTWPTYALYVYVSGSATLLGFDGRSTAYQRSLRSQ